MRLSRISCFFIALCLFFQAAHGADKFKRVAVMPFENITQEKALDWLGGGIAETLTTELGRIPDFTLVERNRLNDALKEIKLGQSGAVDPATAQKMGKVLGADSIVVGSFQKVQQEYRIQARVIDVETGQVRAPARVDGKDILQLQVDIATSLLMEMKGSVAEAEKKKLESLPSKNLDALQALSDGAYFLRSDLTEDALKEFERAIMLDPNFTEAHYYKGVALAKLQKWDEAATALKRTLPRTQTEQTVKWNWEAPFGAQNLQRGLFFGIDRTALSTQGPSSDEQRARLRKHVIYTERAGSNTVLHFVDFAKRTSTRVQIPDDKIPLATGGIPATDRVAVIPATTPAASLQQGTTSLYGVSPDGGVLWHLDLVGEAGKLPPDFNLQGSTLFEFYSNSQRIVAADAVTGKPRWERNGLISTSWSFRTKGNLALVTSPSDKKIHGIRLSDGTDAWTFDYAASTSYQLATEQTLIVFEPDKGVFAIDLTTGKVFAEVAVPPLMINNPSNPYIFSVPSLVENNTLYFVSKANELHAVDLNPNTAANRRLLWKTPFQVHVQNIFVHGTLVYAGAETGEFLVVDRATGSIRSSKKVTDRPLSVDEAYDNVVLTNTNAMVMAFDTRTGDKLWEYPSIGGLDHVKGIVLTVPVARQFAALDAATGNVIWQNSGAPVNDWAEGDSLFVIEANGIKEYALDRTAKQAITNKEAMTELASVLVSKGDLDEAARFADRVAKESDPNYPPLRYVLSRIQQARGNASAARRELITYTDLVGRQSKAAQDVIAGLKRTGGVLWQTEIPPQIFQTTEIVDGKMLGASANGLLAVDMTAGNLLWRQNLDHYFDMVYDEKSKHLIYAYGEAANPSALHIYSIGIDGTDRRELCNLTAPGQMTFVRLANANGTLFVANSAIERQSGKTTLTVSAFNDASGNRLWEKTHEYTPAQMAQIRVTLGLFSARGNFLAYSSGRDMWVLQSEDGKVYAEDHESAAILGSSAHSRSATIDPDMIYFSAGTNEIVSFRLSSKQITQRTKVTAQDPAFQTCACTMLGTTTFDRDGTALIAFDTAAGLSDDKRLKWKITPAPNQIFAGTVLDGDSLLAVRIENNTTLAFSIIDPATGKLLSDFEPLWMPPNAASMKLRDNKLYVLTPDGMAYAMQLGAGGK